MNVLAINVGNSRTAAGWFSKGKIRRSARSETASPVILEAVANDEKALGLQGRLHRAGTAGGECGRSGQRQSQQSAALEC